MDRWRFRLLHDFAAKRAVPLAKAEHGSFVGVALRSRIALVGTFIFLFTADIGFIAFYSVIERGNERLGAGGMAQAVQDMPSVFLCNFQPPCQRRGCNGLFVVRDPPNRHEPLAKGQFCIVENRTDFDRKVLAATTTPEGSSIRKVLIVRPAALRTKFPSHHRMEDRWSRHGCSSGRIQRDLRGIRTYGHGVTSVDNPIQVQFGFGSNRYVGPKAQMDAEHLG